MPDKKNPATHGNASTGELTYPDFDGYNNSKLTTAKASNSKPTLLIDKTNPDIVIDSLTNILMEAGGFYDYGGLSEVVRDTVSGNLTIKRVDRNRLILLAHRLARPCAEKTTGDATVRVNCQPSLQPEPSVRATQDISPSGSLRASWPLRVTVLLPCWWYQPWYHPAIGRGWTRHSPPTHAKLLFLFAITSNLRGDFACK